MSVRHTARTICDALAKQDAVRKGILPGNEMAPAPASFQPPVITPGEVSSPEEWQNAIQSLDFWMDAVEKSIEAIKGLITSDVLKKAELKLQSKEAMARIASASADADVFTFSYEPLSFERDIENLPERTCEIDYFRQYATLKQENGWCSKRDISSASVYWQIAPKSCTVKQTGNFSSIVEEDSDGWALTITGPGDITLTIDVELKEAVECNAIAIEYSGKVDDVTLYVDDSKVNAVDKHSSLFVFPQKAVKKLQVVFKKTGYDDENSMTNYLFIRSIAAYLNRYLRSGIYVTPAVKPNGTEVCISPDIVLPPGCSADIYLGYQSGKKVEWYKTESGTWMKLHKLDDEISEEILFTATDREGIHKIYEFEERPIRNSIRVYGAYRMFVVESKQANGGTLSLKDWYETKDAADRAYIDTDAILQVKAGRIYRLFTHIFVTSDNGCVIDSWAPGPAGIPASVYLNWAEQIPQGGVYTIRLKKGWNLLEVIVKPAEDGVFSPLFPIDMIDGIVCGFRGPLNVVDLRTLIHGDVCADQSIGFDGSSLYVKQDGAAQGPLRFLCRYYTDRENDFMIRAMIEMKNTTGEASPILYGCSLLWR